MHSQKVLQMERWVGTLMALEQLKWSFIDVGAVQV